MQRRSFFLSFVLFVLLTNVLCGAGNKKIFPNADEFIRAFKRSHPYYFFKSKNKKTFEKLLRRKVFGKHRRLNKSLLKKKMKKVKADCELSDEWFQVAFKKKKLECPLCIRTKQSLIFTPCGHFFCNKCLLTHHCSSQVRKKMCPFCTKDLGGKLLLWLQKRKRYKELKQKYKYEREIDEQYEMIERLQRNLRRLIRRGTGAYEEDDLDYLLDDWVFW